MFSFVQNNLLDTILPTPAFLTLTQMFFLIFINKETIYEEINFQRSARASFSPFVVKLNFNNVKIIYSKLQNPKGLV